MNDGFNDFADALKEMFAFDETWAVRLAEILDDRMKAIAENAIDERKRDYDQ